MKKIFFNKEGQTMIILLTYMIIAIIVTTASIALVLNSSSGTDKVYQGTNALDIAESGAETAMIKLLRNPAYSGETLTVGDGQAEVTITGSNPKTIISIGTLNNFKRTIQVIVDTSNNTLTATSWKEI
jgi:hypothetical protein